ncbi:MAG TPA: alpha/beta hydrolase [Dehalococcoidia bacterium]|nr:alpha/beta hydrolase [Dehalococcoidia bacterium]
MFVRRDLTDSVPTREGNMHFVKQGNGYPLVMLHPLGTSTWAWHTVIDSLSQHYTCYAFDMLGHGESDKPKRHFNLPDYARALDDACQVLNIHRGHYVGNSVGACLAIEMAASYPERLDKLSLVGCPVWDTRTGAQRLKDAAGDYDERGLAKPRTLEQLKERRTFAEPRPEWVEATNQTRAQAGEWVRKLSESLAQYDVMSRLPLVKARATQVMYGEHDRLREGEELLHNNIVNASKVVLPGLGHIPQIEDPEAFIDALLDFLRPE